MSCPGGTCNYPWQMPCLYTTWCIYPAGDIVYALGWRGNCLCFSSERRNACNQWCQVRLTLVIYVVRPCQLQKIHPQMKLQVTTQPLFLALCSKVAGHVCYEIFILRTDLSHFAAPLSWVNAILNNKNKKQKNSGVVVADIKQIAKWLVNSGYILFISWLVVFSGFSP